MNRTIYIPWKLGAGLVIGDPIGPCAIGAFYLSNMSRTALSDPFSADVAVVFSEFCELIRLTGGTCDAPIGEANDSITDPHDRALFAQWLFSGIPNPDNPAEPYFEVILLPEHAPMPECPAPVAVTEPVAPVCEVAHV